MASPNPTMPLVTNATRTAVTYLQSYPARFSVHEDRMRRKRFVDLQQT